MSPTISKTDTALVFDHGKIVRDAQKQVQKAIDQLVDAGAERGLQVAAYRGPDLVVDAVAGVADPESGRPVTPDTPFYSYSVGKGATSTIIHILAQRGLFEYDTPVVALWPEFGAHGKQSVTVRHVLNHTAGVPGIPLDTTIEDLCNWDKMCAAIADEELWWEPGTAGGKVSAWAIARMYAALLTEVDGLRLISAERLREVTAVSSTGTDQVFGNPSTWGLGYAIGGLGPAAQDSQTVFGLGGVGGSFACGDTATGIAFAFTKNRLTQDFNAASELSLIVKKALR